MSPKASLRSNLVPRVLSLPRESRERTLGTRLVGGGYDCKIVHMESRSGLHGHLLEGKVLHAGTRRYQNKAI